MKKFLKSGLVTMSVLLALFAVSFASDKAWYDMENCAMCKGLGDAPELMKNMTWEQHDLTNGVIAITTVKPSFKDAYMELNQHMKATGEKIMKGEKVELCGSCETLSGLFAKGVKSEMVETNNGGISLFTSDDPMTVESLHKWSAKNKEEMKKFESVDQHKGHAH